VGLGVVRFPLAFVLIPKNYIFLSGECMAISLNPTVKDVKTVTDIYEKIDSLNQRAWELEVTDPQEGMRVTKEAFLLSTSADLRQKYYQKGIADSLFNQAHFNLKRGDYQLALSQALETLSIYTDLKDRHRQAQTLRHLGGIYLSINEFNKGMSTLIKALDIARNLDDPIPMGETLLNIGMAYLMAGDSIQAMIEFKKSLQIFQSRDDIRLLTYAYCNLAAAYKAQGEYELFYQYLERASRYADQIGYDYIRNDILRQKGQYELMLGNLDTAYKLFQESMQLSQRHGFQADEVASAIWLSEVDYRHGKLQDTIDRLLDALVRSRKNHYDEGCLRAHQKLSLVYEEMSNFKQAYDHLKVFYELEKRINLEKNDLKFKTLETVYRTQALQSEARIIQTKNEQLEKEISERKWVEEALRQSEDKYRRMANLDPLTALNNRRFFYELALGEMRRVKRYHRPMSILMVDLDQFKNVNDRFGHLAGDQVLQWVAQRLQDFLREVDILGRFGGEEFILLLPETPAEQSHHVAQRLCQQFADARFEVRGELVTVTISIGVAAYEDDISLDELIDRADSAMYVAKDAGRNQACLWGTCLPIEQKTA